jgi:hypothetical protein
MFGFRLISKVVISVLISISLLLMAGCSEEGFDVFQDHKIEYFIIQNAYGDSSSEIVPVEITASILQGEHQIKWKTNTVKPYYLKVGISDSFFGEGITYFDTRCNVNGSICGNSGDITCHFTTSNNISCGDVGIDYRS